MLTTLEVENLIRDALIAAKRVGKSKVDFDWTVECVKEDSFSWKKMPDKRHLVDFISQRNQRRAEQRAAEWVKKAHDE